MAYNEQITRANAQGGATPPGGLIPEDAANEIFKEATEASAVMRLARRLPNMSRAQRRLPVVSALPTAYFVNAGQDPSDNRHKQTTHMEWDDVFIDAEEIAVIVPIPENVLADSAYDIWGQVRPALAEAIGVAFDRAVLFGVNAPNVWPDDLMTQITAASQKVEFGGATDVYDNIFSAGGVLALVEEQGYAVNGHLASLRLRAALRGLRTNLSGGGLPIFGQNLASVGGGYTLDGEPLIFPRNGALTSADDELLISGDWNRLVYAVRQDVTWKMLDQAVITDPGNSNAIVYNLAQQDMVALRVVFRAGWALPKPISRLAGANAVPFAALVDEVS